MKTDAEKYRESIEQIWHLKNAEQKQAFKQDAHFKHLFEFEAWIMEQKSLVSQLHTDSLTNKSLEPRLEKATIYLKNMIKAFNYSCEIFTAMNFAELKNNELNQSLLDASQKISELEKQLFTFKSMENF